MTLTFDLEIQSVHHCPQLHLNCKFGEIFQVVYRNIVFTRISLRLVQNIATHFPRLFSPALCIQVLVWQNSKSEINYNE